MVRYPAADAHADGRDLGLGPAALDPHPDAARAPLAAHPELGQGGDQPVLEPADVGAHVRAPRLEVEQHVGDALAGAVVGVAAAAAARVHRQARRLEQLVGAGAGSGGIQRRVLEQPHQLAGAALADRGHALLHPGDGSGVGDGARAGAPLGIARRPARKCAGLRSGCGFDMRH